MTEHQPQGADGVTVRRLVDLPSWRQRIDEIDAIFFVSSGTQTFADAATRAAFRQRWLGRYLDHDLPWVFVAQSPDGAIVGYLLGCIDDPAVTPRFSDIAYFADLAHVTRVYPAHLHINCAPQWRSRGIGARLVAAFLAALAQHGVPGVHVVTGAGLRNVGFYTAQGFRERAQAHSNGKPVVFLARPVAPA